MLFIALKSNELPLYVTNDYAEQNFAQQISQIPGVAQVSIFGQQKFAVRVQVDPEKAAARNLTLDEIAKQVAAANSNAPVGVQLGRRQNVTIEATGQINKAENYRPLVVAWRNGARSGWTRSPMSATASTTIRSPPGSATSARSFSPSTASPTPIRSTSSTR